MRGMWLIASRGRAALLEAFFASAIATGMKEPGVVLVGEQDFKGDYARLSLPNNWMMMETRAEQFGDKIREAEPLFMGLDWAGILVDDHRPETPGWEKLVLDEVRQGYIGSTEDGTDQVPKRLVGAVAWPCAILRAVGYLFPRNFNHLFIDDVWETLARETKCWRGARDAMVRHVHPFGCREPDQTHLVSYSTSNWAHDQHAFDMWKLYVRPNSIRAIRSYLEALHCSSGAGDNAVPSPAAQPEPVAAGAF